MRRFFSILTVILLVSSSCVKEVALPVNAEFDFEVENQDYTVPVKVKITNLTEGADTFEWEFEGATPATSQSRNPGTIIYDTPGEYTIRLSAFNRDESEDFYEKSFVAKPAVNIGFIADVVGDNFSPVEVKITNTTVGATSYTWVFEGGEPATSTQQYPENVFFETPGTHTISLTVSNGDEEYVKEEFIEVNPYLVANFDYTVAFEDDDLQVPVKVSLQNNSISATEYEWTFTGATPETSTVENPEIVLHTPGTYTLQLKATNGKEEKTAIKTITVVDNTNIRTFENIKLGINTAHKNNTVGSFFSTVTREVYTANQITEEIGSTIDIVFFGLNESFIYNKFVSPDEAQLNSFQEIPNATTTKIINSLEVCNCTANITVSDFDAMQDDATLASLVIDATQEGLKEFDNTQVPRIVIFETADGRKGAIKIKEFVNSNENSYITIDIKVQKEAR
ncbi:PKD domain-containing protein [Tenacibaculum sp. IB213877]|uniref:PKD domain-containing protein n=1 Tax=Tenacibaculum sp. IB213877 TaxID=3097351 RepID=UPI002A5A5380|nr:PKD domain-containing protein [Tenacibaculum sp. IB213877]MDY0779350.1 PKD domain-containing protein [Tenacibaculum sp. IB213877]